MTVLQTAFFHSKICWGVFCENLGQFFFSPHEALHGLITALSYNTKPSFLSVTSYCNTMTLTFELPIWFFLCAKLFPNYLMRNKDAVWKSTPSKWHKHFCQVYREPLDPCLCNCLDKHKLDGGTHTHSITTNHYSNCAHYVELPTFSMTYKNLIFVIFWQI